MIVSIPDLCTLTYFGRVKGSTGAIAHDEVVGSKRLSSRKKCEE